VVTDDVKSAGSSSRGGSEKVPDQALDQALDQLLFKWPVSPQIGIFKSRYKRFFADIELNGEIVTAHVPNTGSLKSVLSPNARALILPSQNPDRKLKWTLLALEVEGQWVGVDTSVPLKAITQIYNQQLISDWAQRGLSFRAEVKINDKTRLDALIELKENKKLFIEIKNVTLGRFDTENQDFVAFFPDAQTVRGKKHLEELMALKDLGYEAMILFVIQRTDCSVFSAASDIDLDYAKTLKMAINHGVICKVVTLKVTPTGVFYLPRPVQIKI